MNPGLILYSDSLVGITDEAIVFKAYYFPFGSKRVPLADIAGIDAERPTLWNGRYRIHGTGDLVTWFARDWHRPSRPVIFFVRLRGSSRRIGFTVENADRVERLLRDKCLLRRSAAS